MVMRAHAAAGGFKFSFSRSHASAAHPRPAASAASLTASTAASPPRSRILTSSASALNSLSGEDGSPSIASVCACPGASVHARSAFTPRRATEDATDIGVVASHARRVAATAPSSAAAAWHACLDTRKGPPRAGCSSMKHFASLRCGATSSLMNVNVASSMHGSFSSVAPS